MSLVCVSVCARQIHRCLRGRWMMGVGLSASVVATAFVYFECSEGRAVSQTRHTESEFQDQGWQAPSRFLETRPDLADGNPLLRARFLLPVLLGIPGAARQRRENVAGVPRGARGGGDKLRGIHLGFGTKRLVFRSHGCSPVPGRCGPGVLLRSNHYPAGR